MIKVWDYLKEYESEKIEIHEAIDSVLQSGWLVLGQNVEKFEEQFARYCHLSHGTGVNSGTDALFLAMKTLGVGHGDEVITVSNTAVPTVSAIASTGATARFVDIKEDDYLMDVEQLESVISSKTKCILPVHLYGQCVDMEPLLKLAKTKRLAVLEDCAQAHGAVYKENKAGSMSDCSAFSFYPTKILGGFGDGGMVLTNNEELDKKLKRLRFYGMDGAYRADEHGYNSRLDELHAAILLKKLSHLDAYVKRRREIAKKYDQALRATSLVLPVEKSYGKHAYYLYVVRHEKRDLWLEKLKQKGVALNVSYRWPIHLMKAYASWGYKTGDLPVTEKMADEIFSLPMYPSLTDSEQDQVLEAILSLDKELK